ncbi:MAG: ABC transporter substrate-binding protein [Thermoanaerobaculia bacterium]
MTKTRALVMIGVATIVLIALVISRKEKIDSAPSGARFYKIGIVYTEPHPVLADIIQSFKAEVSKSLPGTEFIEKHGSGSKAQYPSVVRSVIAEKVDVLVPVTTPMSIEALSQAKGVRIPVVFLGVTDPVGAGLVDSLERPVRSTGVSDNPPMEGVISLVRSFLPNAKNIGIPYDPKDQPGVVTARRAENIARQKGFLVELMPVTSESELRASVRGLASRTDAIVIGMDNLMMKNAGIISQTAALSGKPVFAADDKSVEMGAVGGVGVSYKDVGKLGGQLVVKILKTKVSAGTLPVATLTTGDIFVNEAAAKGVGISLPEKIRSKAKIINQK